MTFLYSLFSSIEFYYKKNKFISFATITGALLNIILNLIFIPIFGYVAAAYTTLIGYIIMVIMHYVFYRIITPQPIFDMKRIMSFLITFLIISSIAMMLYPYPMIRIGIIFIFTIAMIIKRKYIFEIIRNMKS